MSTVVPKDLLDAFLSQAARRPGHPALAVEVDPGRPVAGDSRGRRGDSPLRWVSWRSLAARVALAAELLLDRFRAYPARPRVVGHASGNTLADVVIALACPAVDAVECPFDGRQFPGPPTGDSPPVWPGIGGVWLDQAWKLRLETASNFPAHPLFTLSRITAATRGGGRFRPDRPALILWTSGTTDSPKGVTLSDANLVGNASAKLAAVPQSVSDVRLTSLPLCHAYARTCDLGTWLLSGGRLAVTQGLDGWRRIARQVRPTLANTVPSLASRLLETDPAEFGLGRLKLLGCGGAAMTADAFARWRDRGVTVIQGYGLTEASPVICSATPGDAVAGWVGKPVAGWQARIRDGRLQVRGPHTMLGYWGDADATRRRIDGEGWLDTGDIVEVDAANGQYRILGRADEVIVLANGYKVHPSVVERLLETVPGVRHAVVVAGRCGDGTATVAWLDADVADRDWESESFRHRLGAAVAALPPWQRPRRFERLDPPLSRDRGELTAKGTVRRSRIVETRELGTWPF